MEGRFKFLEFNIGIFFISTSAVLGRYITASSLLTTFLRCAIAAVCLALIVRLLGRGFHFNWRRHGWLMIGSSLLMAAHWTLYFYSLDFSSVSVGLMTIYTFPAMTAIIEPLWYRRRIPRTDIILAVIALTGVVIIAPPSMVSGQILWAIVLGLLSALAYSIRNVWIVGTSHEYAGTTFMFYQVLWMSVFMSPCLFYFDLQQDGVQWIAILFLGVITTAGGHTLFLRGLNYYSATTASIMSCMVPVYGLSLGYFWLGEEVSLQTAIGSLIILSVVVWKAVEAGRIGRKLKKGDPLGDE